MGNRNEYIRCQGFVNRAVPNKALMKALSRYWAAITSRIQDMDAEITGTVVLRLSRTYKSGMDVVEAFVADYVVTLRIYHYSRRHTMETRLPEHLCLT